MNFNLNLCQYKDMLGAPRTGFRATHRFMDFAYIDVLVTLACCVFLSYVFKTSFLWTCVFVFGLGILVHRLFCVRTKLDTILFPE
jgi:hypothetical protein